ncbi:UNVERIFIED_CONTAM: hypothetical protein HHA_243382 [Hammondia hammondi]|eukprot:XP_008884356.1 hypothetical protein HHA_243382 [Hammondia hammondi]
MGNEVRTIRHVLGASPSIRFLYSTVRELDIGPFSTLIKNTVEKRPITPGAYSIFDDAQSRSCVATELAHRLKDCPLKADKKKPWRLRQLAIALQPPLADPLDLRLMMSLFDLSACEKNWQRREVVLVNVPGREQPVEVPRKLATHLLMSLRISRAYSANASADLLCRRDQDLASRHQVSCRRVKSVVKMRKIVQSMFDSVYTDNLQAAQATAAEFEGEWNTAIADDVLIQRVNDAVLGNAFADSYAILQEKIGGRGARMFRFLVRLKLTGFLSWFLERLISKLPRASRSEDAAAALSPAGPFPAEVLDTTATADAAHLACGSFEKWVQDFGKELTARVLKRRAQDRRRDTAFLERESSVETESAAVTAEAEGSDSETAAGSPTVSPTSFLGVREGQSEPSGPETLEATPPITNTLASGVMGADKVILSSKIRRSIAELLTVLISTTLAADTTLPLWFPATLNSQPYTTVGTPSDQ